MPSSTFSISLKKILDGMSEKQVEAIKYAADFSMTTVYDNIASSVQDGGLSPYDHFRFTYGRKNYNRKAHLNSRWYMRNRSSKHTISYEIRNRAVEYYDFLFSNKSSEYHPNGWRSYRPHKEIKYDGKIYKRTSQMSQGVYDRKMYLYKIYVLENILRHLQGKTMKEEL